VVSQRDYRCALGAPPCQSGATLPEAHKPTGSNHAMTGTERDPSQWARPTRRFNSAPHVAGTSTPSVPTTGTRPAGQPGNTCQRQAGQAANPSAPPVPLARTLKLAHSYEDRQVNVTLITLCPNGVPLTKPGYDDCSAGAVRCGHDPRRGSFARPISCLVFGNRKGAVPRREQPPFSGRKAIMPEGRTLRPLLHRETPTIHPA
jgi:hypothetical protein